MIILVAGDWVPRYRTAVQIENGDYSCMEEAKPIIRSADYAIVNFEAPVVMHKAIPILKTGPNLRCSNKAMECVAQAGFSCVTLANNHFRDFGQLGVEDTLQACTSYNVDYVGGGKNINEAERFLCKSINGQQLAIINVCENEWSIASDKSGGSAPLDPIRIYYRIREARKVADFVLVIVHGGIEGYQYPTPRMQETYRFFVDAGADAVVNHHQHCYSGYEVYHKKPIFYGLGNFCFDKRTSRTDRMWEEGFMVRLHFSDKIDFELFPYSQCDEKGPSIKILSDKKCFNDSIRRINSVIENENQVRKQFEQRGTIGKRNADSILIPYESSFFRKLYAKRLFPSFVTDNRRRRLQAYVQCESHRETLLLGLKSINNK